MNRVVLGVVVWLVASVAAAQEEAVQQRTVRLALPLSGVVESVLVEPGARVEKGQTLLRLDTRRYEIRLRAAEAGLNEIEVDLAEAALELSRQQELFERLVTTESDLNEAQRAVSRLKAQMIQREAVRDEALLDLERTVLNAPRDGVVLERRVEPGEVVSDQAAPQVLILLGVQ